MRLENVVAVTGGRLLNTPSISRFDTVALLPSKAVRGSLFVARDTDDIDTALKNGAYGIITDQTLLPTDEEVAWIVVKNLSDALMKLLRLWLVINPRNFVPVTPQVMEFMEQIMYGHGSVLLRGDTMDASEKILASSAGQTIFSDDKTFLDHIGAAISPAKPDSVSFIPVADYTFESSFILDGTYYERVHLAPCMHSLLIEAVGLLKAAETGYTLSHLEHTPSFKPLFVDTRMQPVAWGSSEQVLIFTDISVPKSCFEQFNGIKWTACKLFLPTQIKFVCDIKIAMDRYNTASELVNMFNLPLKPGYYIIAGVCSDVFFDLIDTSTHNFETKGLF